MHGGHSFLIPALYLSEHQAPPMPVAMTLANGVHGGPLCLCPPAQCAVYTLHMHCANNGDEMI